jgi:uncharacterized protein YkwD
VHYEAWFYNRFRVHKSLEGQTPIPTAESKGINFNPTAGRNIVAVYTKRQRLHEHEFAIHTVN